MLVTICDNDKKILAPRNYYNLTLQDDHSESWPPGPTTCPSPRQFWIAPARPYGACKRGAMGLPLNLQC